VIGAEVDPTLLETLWQFVQDYPDPVIIGIFILCGCGLPVPEEPILLMAGAVAHQLSSGQTAGMGLQLTRITADCAVGILLGDLVCFLLGRTLGPGILRMRLVRRIATRPRRARAEKWFEDYGAWSIFIARFFAGVRIVMYFTAGMSRKVSYLRFLFMDFLGVLVSVPVSVWIGYKVTQELSDWEKAKSRLGHFHLILVAALVVGLVVWLVLARKKKVKDRAEEGAAEPEKPPEPAE